MALPQVTIRSLSEDYCEFVLAGVDVAFANALRRIMIAEVRVELVVKEVKEGRDEIDVGAGDEEKLNLFNSF
jgi:DNA-directed RNA polymerase alpha subunit